MEVKLNDFIRDLNNMKEAIATLSASTLELEGRIRYLEDYISTKKRRWNSRLKLRENGGILRAKEIELRA